VCSQQVIRDNLDVGRPDRVSLTFDRKGAAPRPERHTGPFPHGQAT